MLTLAIQYKGKIYVSICTALHWELLQTGRQNGGYDMHSSDA